MPVVVTGLSGRVKRWYRSGSITTELQNPSGMGFDIYGATYERDYGRWEGEAGESITMRLPPSVFLRYFQDEASNLDLETGYGILDDTLRNNLLCLADEIQRGFPNGRLYAEGLSIMVVGWLVQHYAKIPVKSVPLKHGLSVGDQVKVTELIESSLDSPLSVEHMAAEVNVSPYYFSRLFRLSFGQSPHQYLLSKRIDRAKTLLQDQPDRSVADVALHVGFSNQAHFCEAFKKLTGLAPSGWRNKP
jgi:AraC-like DNA-binding protein